MRKIRVLIVDDAVVIRRMLTDILASDPEIEVAGTAPNGRIALARIPQVNPDVVTLDIEMPEMDGLETLKGIRETYRDLPVIMFSALTQRGAGETLDALALGANDYVTKPSNVGSVTAASEAIRRQLIPRLKAFCGRRAGLDTHTLVAAHPTKPATLKRRKYGKPPSRIDVVAIGVSTGGPNTLMEIIPHLPEDFPVPVLIVQHMPPVFTKTLAERLDSNSRVPVQEGRLGSKPRPGTVWLAPGGFHMTVENIGGMIRLATNEKPPENSCRPAVDVLFRSVCQVYGGNVLGVILTGMGQDGLRGCHEISDAGGYIFAQDEATSVVWGMPGYVAEAGLADKILPMDQVAAEIVRAVTTSQPNIPALSAN